MGCVCLHKNPFVLCAESSRDAGVESRVVFQEKIPGQALASVFLLAGGVPESGRDWDASGFSSRDCLTSFSDCSVWMGRNSTREGIGIDLSMAC